MKKKHLLPDNPIITQDDRAWEVKMTHPDKINWDDFETQMKEYLDPFIANMRNLKSVPESDFMENKITLFTKWVLD